MIILYMGDVMNLYDDISDYIFVKNKPQKANMIFVVGGTFPEPAECAAELIKLGFSERVFVSGRYSKKTGQFPGAASKGEIYNSNYLTESDFFSDVLIKNGVEENRIICEDRSMFTFENAMQARELTKDMNIKTAILCCQSFHARRALMYYQLYFSDVTWLVYPADTQGITKDNWFKSEKGIETVMSELSRIGEQFSKIFLNNLKG